VKQKAFKAQNPPTKQKALLLVYLGIKIKAIHKTGWLSDYVVWIAGYVGQSSAFRSLPFACYTVVPQGQLYLPVF